MKQLVITFRNGEIKAIPVELIAKDRAKYYSERDETTSYKEEFDFAMQDETEIIDWFTNNMDWKDVEEHAEDRDSEAIDYAKEILENKVELQVEACVKGYDSGPDTHLHIEAVQGMLEEILCALDDRAAHHDFSKLLDPEKEIFDKVTPKLKELEYGTDKYKKALEEMGPALTHHYKNNRHHPEHFENGIQDMNIIDLIEMMCDWNAARLRHKNPKSFEESLEINRKRFNIPDEIVGLIKRTHDYLNPQSKKEDK